MSSTNTPNLECRMYESRYPEVDMAVMIQVKNIADMGAYVSLLEYNNIEGMILFSELSRRRIHSVNSLIKVGRQEPVMVLRVDEEKGCIDLSKRRVSKEDIQACEERYNKSKLVHSIMRHVAETMVLDLEDLYVHVGWPLYRKYGHAFEAFKLIVTNPDSILDGLTREVNEVGPDGKEVTRVVPALTAEVKDVLVKNIRRRMTPQPLKIRADVKMKSKLFHSIMRHVAETMVLDLEDLYVHVGWPLYWKYGHAFEAFKLVVTDPDSILDGLTREVNEVGPDGKEVTRVVPALTAEVKDALVKNIRRRMTPQPLKIRADVEMKCFQFDGVLHIKEAMKKAEAAGNDDCPVKIKLVAPPLYVLTTQTLDMV